MRLARGIVVVGVGLAVVATVLLLAQRRGDARGERSPTAVGGPLSVEVGEGGPPRPDLAGPDSLVNPPVSPIAVDLREVPAGVPDPNSALARWQRGEWQPEREGLPVTDAELERLRREAEALPPSAAVQRIADSPAGAGPSIGTSFDSIHFAESSGSVPPDPDLAVGPNHIVAAVNVEFEVYDTSGTSLTGGPVSFASFFSGLGLPFTGVFFDPNVLYDEETGRFMVAIDYTDDASQTALYLVGVSQGSNAAGSYWVYGFPMNASNAAQWMDYPHAGIGRDAIYVGGNMFTFSGDSFTNARIWALDKHAMYAGGSASSAEKGLGASEFTPQPVKLHGYSGGWPTGNLHYVLSKTDTFSSSKYRVWSWDRPFGVNTLTDRGFVDLQTATGVTASVPVNSLQLGGGTLAGNDLRPLDLEWGAGSIWTAQTIGCNPGGGTVNCIRWAEINPSNPAAVVQAGVWTGNGIYLSFPDLAVDACGNMVIGYTKTSSNLYPSVWAAGRSAGSPLGTLDGEVQLKAGEVNYTSFEPSSPRRWGDYTGMTVAPDGASFWYLGEYSKNTGTTQGRWGNWIAQLSMGGCGAGAIFSDGFEGGNLSTWSAHVP